MSTIEPSFAPQPVALNIVCIVPFLNEAQHLQTFLDSLAGQLRFPDQIVLVDDGSSDASPRMAAEFAATHQNVSFFRRPPGRKRPIGWPRRPSCARFSGDSARSRGHGMLWLSWMPIFS